MTLLGQLEFEIILVVVRNSKFSFSVVDKLTCKTLYPKYLESPLMQMSKPISSSKQ